MRKLRRRDLYLGALTGLGALFIASAAAGGAVAAGWLEARWLGLLPVCGAVGLLSAAAGGGRRSDRLAPALGLAVGLSFARPTAWPTLCALAAVAVGGAVLLPLLHNLAARLDRRPAPVEPADILAGARLGAALVGLAAVSRFGFWPELMVVCGLGGLLARRLPAWVGRLLATLAELLPMTAARRSRRLLDDSRGRGPQAACDLALNPHRPLPLALDPFAARRRLAEHAVLREAFLVEGRDAAAHHSEAAWRLTAPLAERPDAGAEVLADAADLAFRTARWADAISLAARLIAALRTGWPTVTEARWIRHARLLSAMSLARLGQTVAAEAELRAVRAEGADDADALVLGVLAETTLRLARGERWDVATYLRGRIAWTEKEPGPTARWWRAHAQALAAEAALLAGELAQAEMHAVGSPQEAPRTADLALLLAEARRRRGDRSGEVDALRWAAVLAEDGPLGQRAEALLTGLDRSS